METFIFKQESTKDIIFNAVFAADTTTEIWENGIMTQLSSQQIDEVVPDSVMHLVIKCDGDGFSTVIRDGFRDIDEQGFVYDASGAQVARI